MSKPHPRPRAHRAPDPALAALWESDNPTYGTVRHVIISGAWAARLDDLNSDFREVELTLFHIEGDGCHAVAHADDVGYPEHDQGSRYGWDGGVLWALGFGPPGSIHEISYDNERNEVVADADGWWLFVTDSHGPGDPWPQHAPPAGATESQAWLQYVSENAKPFDPDHFNPVRVKRLA